MGHLGPAFARASSEAREAIELSAVVLRAHLG
jgi:hypothetical protein